VLVKSVSPVNISRLKPELAQPDTHNMSYRIILRSKGFWVVRFLSAGLYETVEKHATRAEAEQAMEALQNRDRIALFGRTTGTGIDKSWPRSHLLSSQLTSPAGRQSPRRKLKNRRSAS
jgi:hypothetical protein